MAEGSVPCIMYLNINNLLIKEEFPFNLDNAYFSDGFSLDGSTSQSYH